MFSQLFSLRKVGIGVNIELKIDRMGAFFVCGEQGLKEGRKTEGKKESLLLAASLLLIFFPQLQRQGSCFAFSASLFISQG